MDIGGSGTRELYRRDSTGDGAVKPTPGDANIKKGEAHNADGGIDALDFGAGKPVTSSRQAGAPLAPLQRVTLYDKRNIAECLTFTEAIWLMLASKDMHFAIRADPLLRLDEISPSFERLGCNELVRELQAIEMELSRLRMAPGPHASHPEQVLGSTRLAGPGAIMAGAPADAVFLSFTIAGHAFQIRRSPGRKARDAMQSSRQARERAQVDIHKKEAEKARFGAKLQTLEPAIEELAFHFATERRKGPRPFTASDTAAHPMATPGGMHSRLHRALDEGDVDMVRTGLREFLSLPALLMPSFRKVAWLLEPQGRCTLEDFGQRCCGTLKPLERRQYDALTAYVDEIVSSDTLSAPEKWQLCVKLELVKQDRPGGVNKPVELDIVKHALGRNNPAVAASILLGIHESSAEQQTKQFLLAGIAASWQGDLGNCVDRVINSLKRYEHRAPDWVADVIGRLKSITALTVCAESKG
jgi:hypothetical protein